MKHLLPAVQRTALRIPWAAVGGCAAALLLTAAAPGGQYAPWALAAVAAAGVGWPGLLAVVCAGLGALLFMDFQPGLRHTAAALLIWRALLFSIRRAAIGQGSGNRRAVTLYHHICWLARRTKTEVPAEFLEVAEKARFSHHKLSREELQPLQDHADQLTRQLLADKRFWRQFLYRVIYALG